MPWLVNSHPCDQKSPFRKGQMMNEPNRTEWIIRYLSSHWIFVTQGRHSCSATDTSALRDFLGCQKNHGPLISDHKFTSKQATSDTRFPMKCGAFVDYKTPLMTGSFVKFPMVLRLYPTRSISCAICTCIPSHSQNQWKKTLCFLSIYNKFRILLSDQSFPYRMPYIWPVWQWFSENPQLFWEGHRHGCTAVARGATFARYFSFLRRRVFSVQIQFSDQNPDPIPLVGKEGLPYWDTIRRTNLFMTQTTTICVGSAQVSREWIVIFKLLPSSNHGVVVKKTWLHIMVCTKTVSFLPLPHCTWGSALEHRPFPFGSRRVTLKPSKFETSCNEGRKEHKKRKIKNKYSWIHQLVASL